MSDADDIDEKSINIFDEKTRIAPSAQKTAGEPKVANYDDETIVRPRGHQVDYQIQEDEPVSKNRAIPLSKISLPINMPQVDKRKVAMVACAIAFVAILARMFAGNHSAQVTTPDESIPPNLSAKAQPPPAHKSEPVQRTARAPAAATNSTAVQNLTSSDFISHFRNTIDQNQNLGRDSSGL